ncbi:hypothetical protein AVEN_65981-1 [Araneus ventricosus]|uniref:Uncharacterized protein n=1 Tax=Araneus ventricosus TaxID=182803 RepID=A0A4Y2FYH3_ARAVE|nr:hypothetical protein AVEN_65981-1 [Araneus ventricosus]
MDCHPSRRPRHLIAVQNDEDRLCVASKRHVNITKLWIHATTAMTLSSKGIVNQIFHIYPEEAIQEGQLLKGLMMGRSIRPKCAGGPSG